MSLKNNKFVSVNVMSSLTLNYKRCPIRPQANICIHFQLTSTGLLT